MTVPLVNTFEGGTDGTTITTGNSGGASGDAFTTVEIGTGYGVTYENSPVLSQAMCGAITPGATSATSQLMWEAASVGTIGPTIYTRFYLRWEDIIFGAINNRVMRMRLGAAQRAAIVTWGTVASGKYTWADAADSGGTTSTLTMVPDTLYRFECQWTLSATVGQAVINVYDGNSMTLLETLSSAANLNLGGTTMDEIRFGYTVAGSNTAYGPMYLDGLAIGTAGYFGPVVVPSGRRYKRFYGPAQLGSTPATLYTVPVNGRTVIRNIYANNPSGSPVDVTLSIGADADATHIWDADEVPAGDILFARRETNYVLEAGEVLQGFVSAIAFDPPLVDTFDRADQSDLGTASVEGAWSGSFEDANDEGSIVSNQAAQEAGNGHSMHTLTYGPNVQVAVTVSTKPANTQFIGLAARGTDINTANFDLYLLLIGAVAGTDGWELYRANNGSFTLLGSAFTQELTSGNKIGLEVEGIGATVNVTAYIDTGSGFTVVATRADTDASRLVSAGRTGIYWGGVATRLDDYRARTSGPPVLVIDGVEEGL